MIGLAFTVIVARELGPEGFGTYAYVLSFVTILAPLARFGLEAHAMREAASADAEEGAIYVSLVASSITTVAAVILTIIAFMVSSNPVGVTPALMILALPILLTAPFDLIAAHLKGREKIKVLAIGRIIASLAFVVGSAVVLVLAPSTQNFVILRSIDSVLLAAAALIGFIYIRGSAFHGITIYKLKKTMVQCLPLMITVFSTMLFLRIDQVLLGQMSSAEELGHYAVAARIVEIGNILPAILQSTLFGAMVRNFQSGPGGLDYHMQSVFDLFALSGWGAALAMGLAAALFLEPVFGRAYAESMPMLGILLVGMPFYFLFYAIGTELAASGRYWTGAGLTAAGAATNIVLNLALIPRFGGAGAGWASVIAYFVAGIGAASLTVYHREAAGKMVRALNPIGAARRLMAVYYYDARHGKQT